MRSPNGLDATLMGDSAGGGGAALPLPTSKLKALLLLVAGVFLLDLTAGMAEGLAFTSPGVFATEGVVILVEVEMPFFAIVLLVPRPPIPPLCVL